MVKGKVLMVNGGLVIVMLLGLVGSLSLSSGQEVAGEEEVSRGVREEALISINIKDADIKNVLRLIATSANVNIISGRDVTGTVSVRIKDVPWETALATILKTYGFAYVREENIIRVTTIEKLKKEGLQTKTYFLNFATAADIQESIKEVLSERGKIKTDERTNALIITDVPGYLTEVERIIKELDTETVQVSIEAKIMEVTLAKGEDLGISWGTEISATGSQRPTIWPFETKSGSKWTPEDFPTGGTFKFGILDATGLSATLKMLRQRTDTNLLQSPRVTTLNNQEATLTTGTQYPIPTYAYNADTGQWEITGFEYLDLGITLKVTPNVNREGYITMKIHPTVNEMGDKIQFGTGAGAANIPSYTTREAETQVMIRDAQTIVIGGLMEAKEQEVVTKVPVLGDIPLLGYLFRKRTLDKAKNVKTDLVIFITAYIVKPGEVWEEDRLKLERLEYPEKQRLDEIRKETVKSLYQVGKSYYRERKYDEAIEQFRKALELDPTHRGARRYLKRAERYLEKRK